jgi:putative DNA primase/helicase
MFEAGEHDIEELEADPIDQAADGIPRGFQLRQDGVYRLIEAEESRRWVWLCSRLRVLALPRGGDGRNWGRLIEVTDPDGRAHRWAMPMALLAGDGGEMRAVLLGLGLRLTTDRGSRAALSALVQNWTPTARARTVDRLGWADETWAAFVLANGRVIGDDNIVFQSETAPDAVAAMTAAGTLDDWREHVAAPCLNNPLLVFAMSCGFAGPLLEPLGQEGGGVHFRGSSSCGKSTSQRGPVSIWGAPDFIRTWRATSNGLEGVAAACNGSILVLDELGQIDGREAGAVAYMLGNGAGKARANRHGGARASARWRLIYLSSGEISLADKMAEAGKLPKAGQEVRLLDIAADTRKHGVFDDLHGAENGAAFADKLTAAAARFYGTAGPAFVEALLQDLDAARAEVRVSMGAFEAEAQEKLQLGSDGQVARALKRFALVAVAGELASALGITGWPSGEAHKAALVALEIWLNGRGGVGDHESKEAIRRTRAFLTAHESRFEPLDFDDESHKLVIHNRAGWKNSGFFYISTDAWKEIHAGADATRAAKALEKDGLLERGDGKNIATRITTSKGRPRAYAVRVMILGVGDGGAGDDEGE